MGVRLARHLGKEYLSVGGAFGEGSYPAELPPGGRRFDLPPPDSMDGALGSAGIGTFFLDLRAAGNDPVAKQWFAQPRRWRAQDADAMLVPAAAFDLVF